jgi:NADPH2:quinone reductase
MKAAVIYKFGDTPRYEEFPDPVPSQGDSIIHVKAVVLENFDKVTVAGTHYASKAQYPVFPAIVGHNGVGVLEDGTLVAFGGTKPPYGTMAEKAVVPQKFSMFMSKVPQGIAPEMAAAVLSTALVSFLPLRYGVKLQAGETVLINGVSGASGRVAVQIAKKLGAEKIIGTGRNEEALKALSKLGVDVTINTTQSDEDLAKAFTGAAPKGYDIVLDFLWGKPTEVFLRTLVPKEASFVTHRTRFVQIGESAGPTISLPAEAIRTSGLELLGASNIPPEAVPDALKEIWKWVEDGALQIDIEKVPLSNIAEAWKEKTDGKRIVIIP